MRYTRLIFLFCFFFTVFQLSAHTLETLPNVQLQDSTRFVSNPDGVLSPQTEAQLNQMLHQLRIKTTVEPAIVIARGIETDDFQGFATELFEKWGLGASDRDNGLLILIDPDAPNITMRTGYGVEGALPDSRMGQLFRQYMSPSFKQGDYDRGLLQGVTAINEILMRPENADELRSKKSGDGDTFWGVLGLYLFFVVAATLVLLVSMLTRLLRNRKAPDNEKYMALSPMLPMLKGMSWVCLGLPLPMYWWLKQSLHKWRDRPRQCPNCQHEMHKMDEEHDNDYLTPSQDKEERLGSVDYDVWVCPNCNEVDIFPFVQKDTPYVECPECHARTARLMRASVVKRPTSRQPGMGVRTYSCESCRKMSQVPYEIPVTQDGAATAAIIGAIAASAMRGGGGSSGGFGGGGFGGGHTGGGGFSGGW